MDKKLVVWPAPREIKKTSNGTYYYFIRGKRELLETGLAEKILTCCKSQKPGRPSGFGNAKMRQFNNYLPIDTIDKIEEMANKKNITTPVLLYNWAEGIEQ